MTHKRAAHTHRKSNTNVLLFRGAQTIRPHPSRYNPVGVFEQWRRDNLITLTPGFVYRILQPAEGRDVGKIEPFQYGIYELIDDVPDSGYLPHLPNGWATPELPHLVELLTPVVTSSNPRALPGPTVLFPFGEHDVVEFLRRGRSKFLDGRARDQEPWPAGTFVVCLRPFLT